MRHETLPFSAAVRMNEQDKEELRSMTGENPMYSESKIIRAAIRFFGAVSEDKWKRPSPAAAAGVSAAQNGSSSR